MFLLLPARFVITPAFHDKRPSRQQEADRDGLCETSVIPCRENDFSLSRQY